MSDAPWYSEFDGAFWLTLAGALFGFGGVCLQAIIKSNCTKFSCCGISFEREPTPPDEIQEDVELGASPTPSASISGSSNRAVLSTSPSGKAYLQKIQSIQPDETKNSLSGGSSKNKELSQQK